MVYAMKQTLDECPIHLGTINRRLIQEAVVTEVLLDDIESFEDGEGYIIVRSRNNSGEYQEPLYREKMPNLPHEHARSMWVFDRTKIIKEILRGQRFLALALELVIEQSQKTKGGLDGWDALKAVARGLREELDAGFKPREE